MLESSGYIHLNERCSIHHGPSRAVLRELEEAFSGLDRAQSGRWMLLMVAKMVFIYVFNCVLWLRPFSYSLCKGRVELYW